MTRDFNDPRFAQIKLDFFERVNNFHKRPLHSGQARVLQDYFRGIRVCQSQWSRNGGKTETALALGNLACMLTPNFQTMIICPELKQGKKIYWHKKRLQTYAPPKYVKDISSTDLKVEFTNGSLITVDGCENYEALRGVKPDLVIYDEFQHHSKEFHLEVMQPNLISRSTALYIFGTPPKNRSAYYVEFREELLRAIEKGDKESSYYEFDARINPINDERELQKRKKALYDSGNEVIWMREYEGKLVFGGEDVVFPKWKPAEHVKQHRTVLSYLEGDRRKLKWFTICDPGTATCFAVLFVAYNPYTQQIFILDEIYEKDRARTDTRQIFDRIRKKEAELYPGSQQTDWHRVYDEAAAWFQREVIANYKHQYSKINLSPTRKHGKDEEEEISRIKMLMAEKNCLVVSDRCYWLRWEIESYVTDDKGKFPDKNNHLIDCLKYLMDASNWKLIEKAEVNQSHDQVTGTPVPQDPNQWADDVVNDSLTVSVNDLLSEYFD